MTKPRVKPRYEIPQAQNNGPTPERAAKSVFTRGIPPRVLTTVQALLNSGDISQDEANAAERWYRDWAFAYHGVIEFPENHEGDTTTRHDDVSWLMTRAAAAGRLGRVRDALGMCAELRLRMMLVDESSFRQMGAILIPHHAEATAGKKVAAQCAILLEQLSEFYLSMRKEKICTRGAVMV
ncbi:hypothetical protein K2X14_11525 [Acetobacter sp. TBRC 12305]|uniref:Phage protein n=1 Tax=Acetobacter garciniae TaxID=2817435 RepID=A0A939KN71_9PROT|nr:hypothetical protein [Acetobacter garciniae]MBO1325360.1 hypothetical protein [Acetobacter garciniae]MBX0345468.1 hypothetical protein [Acetobacter garciniae]